MSVSSSMAGSAERVLRFGADGALVGILTEPAGPGAFATRPGVVFINAGMVHRVGPNRLYVNLARHLALQGFPCLRFDLSGIGDSQHRSDGLPADESAIEETRQVMTALQITYGSPSFVLCGLCSGAVTAFRTALRDDRVTGTVMLNPQGFHHDAAWNAHVLNRGAARRYVTNAMVDTESWRRAISGRINYRRLAGVITSRVLGWTKRRKTVSPVAGELAAQFRTLAARLTRMLIVCSDGDSSVDYMSAILGRDAARDYQSASLVLRVFPKTDHSLTFGSSQRALFELVDAWAGSFSV